MLRNNFFGVVRFGLHLFNRRSKYCRSVFLQEWSFHASRIQENTVEIPKNLLIKLYTSKSLFESPTQFYFVFLFLTKSRKKRRIRLNSLKTSWELDSENKGFVVSIEAQTIINGRNWDYEKSFLSSYSQHCCEGSFASFHKCVGTR